MDPATMTRGFMGLLSESQDHLNDTEVRVRGVRVSPSRVGEPDPLVEADGGLVAFGDLQFELLQRAGAGPVDGRTEERLSRAPPAPLRLHPHAAHVAGLRMLPGPLGDQGKRSQWLRICHVTGVRGRMAGGCRAAGKPKQMNISGLNPVGRLSTTLTAARLKEVTTPAPRPIECAASSMVCAAVPTSTYRPRAVGDMPKERAR